jgi:sulfur carrier protein ThiS
LGLLLKSGKELHTHSDETLKKLFPGFSKEKIEALKSKVSDNVSILERYNFIEGKRPIRLKYKTPLCWIANTPEVSFAYLGLLGTRKYDVSETETAIKLLREEGINPEKIVVATSQEAIGDWAGHINPDLRIEWLTMDDKKELTDIDKVEERIKPKIIELMKDYVLIMDCTSGPRPAGIAYQKLAPQFKVPLIYVYEPEKRLIWLISKEELTKEIGGVFYIEPEEKVEPTKPRKRVVIY